MKYKKELKERDFALKFAVGGGQSRDFVNRFH